MTERTEQELLKEAIFVQDACNLSGVAHSFSRAMSELRRLHPNEGTDFFNRHPVAVLYASKIASLTCCDDNFSEAYKVATQV